MKVLFLDWYKTLSNSLFWEQIKHTDPEKFEKISVSCFLTRAGLTKPWMRGEYSSEDMVKFIAKDTKLDKKYLLNELEKSASEMKFVSEAVPDLVQKLRKKGLWVVVATDNMDTLTRWTVPAMKLNKLFDEILCSWDIKALKGDFEGKKSLFFDSFFKDHPKIKPSDCTIIDDTEDKNGIVSSYGIDYKNINLSEKLIDVLRSII